METDARPHASASFSPAHQRRSHSPPPHRDSTDDRRTRRPSPVYESYDRVQSRRDQEHSRDEERRHRERDDQRRERERKGDERERRGMERESRRTPERELQSGRGGYGGGRGGYMGGGGAQGRPGGGGGAGDDWAESRRIERDRSTVTIWPASPPPPARGHSPSGKDGKKSSSSRKHKSSSKSHHKSSRRHDSVSSDSSSEDEAERRARRKKHKSSSSRSKGHRSEKSEKRRAEDSEDEAQARQTRDKSASRELVQRRDKEDVEEEEDEDAMWVEKPVALVENEDGEEVGPLPLFVPGQKGGRNSYGGALLKGEGTAMAAFVAEGERIPRRGEIGMDSDQIERFEQIGYVMSGSRHRRMNAVRVRKENQVISAEERRGILKMQAEEKAKRENQIVASFKELVDTKLAGRK